MKKFFKNIIWRWCKRHKLVAGVIFCLFLSTFFVRAESMFIRYHGQDVYAYVRVDYSIYGYCVGVKPMKAESVDTAKDLTKILLLSDIDQSVDTIVDKWSYYYGPNMIFTVHMRGYKHNPLNKRDELIDKIKAMGYRADILV